MPHTIVIPVKAGIQLTISRRREGSWTPAFAAVTWLEHDRD
jgi:hypothetical protein